MPGSGLGAFLHQEELRLSSRVTLDTSQRPAREECG